MKNKTLLFSSHAVWYRIFFLLFFVALTFGQLQRFQVTNSVALYGHEFILLCWAVLYWKVIVDFIRVHILTNNILTYFLVFLVVQTVIQNIISFELTPLLYLLRLGLYVCLYPLISLGISKKLISTTMLYKTILGIGGGIAILGLVQYFLLPDTRFLIFSGWDDHYYRLISTLFDPNFSALIIGISLLTFVYTRNKIFKINSTAQYIITAVFLLSLLLTYSRAGYVALAFGLVTLTVLTRKVFPLGIIVLCLICIPFLPRPGGEGVKLERTASVISRIESNQSALQNISGLEVIFGRGLYRAEQNTVSLFPNHAIAPDNSFVFLFTSLGLIGSGLLLTAFVKSVKVMKSPLTWSCIVLVATHSLFNNSLFYVWTIVLLIVILQTEQTTSIQIGNEK